MSHKSSNRCLLISTDGKSYAVYAISDDDTYLEHERKDQENTSGLELPLKDFDEFLTSDKPVACIPDPETSAPFIQSVIENASRVIKSS